MKSLFGKQIWELHYSDTLEKYKNQSGAKGQQQMFV